MPNSIIFTFLLIVTCISCSENEPAIKLEVESLWDENQENSLFGIWKRIKIVPKEKNRDRPTRRFLYGNEKDYFLAIFPDRKGATVDNTDFRFFTWKKILGENFEKEIKIIWSKNHSSQIEMYEIDGKILLSHIAYDGSKMFYEKKMETTKLVIEDPYHPENNSWRNRAQIKLSDSEIEDKIDNYLLHYKYLFKASLESPNKRTFTNKHSKGIIQTFKSQIGIVEKNKIGEDWYSYFYDKNEAHKAYDILQNKLKSKKKLKATDDWILDNYNIMESITESNE